MNIVKELINLGLSKRLFLLIASVVLLVTIISGCGKNGGLIDMKFGYSNATKQQVLHITRTTLTKIEWSLKAESGSIIFRVSSPQGTLIEANSINVSEYRTIQLEPNDYTITVQMIDAHNGHVVVRTTPI
jgi:hypothetical protein